MSVYGNWRGIPREDIPWHPTVDPAKCKGCQECFKFCSHKVYSWDETAHRAVVVEPHNCVVGCSSCRSLCKEGAITFPPLASLKQFMKQ